MTSTCAWCNYRGDLDKHNEPACLAKALRFYVDAAGELGREVTQEDIRSYLARAPQLVREYVSLKLDVRGKMAAREYGEAQIGTNVAGQYYGGFTRDEQLLAHALLEQLQ